MSVTFFHGKGRSPTSKLESVGLQAKMRSSGVKIYEGFTKAY